MWDTYAFSSPNKSCFISCSPRAAAGISQLEVKFNPDSFKETNPVRSHSEMIVLEQLFTK